jgi:hypothetical protein
MRFENWMDFFPLLGVFGLSIVFVLLAVSVGIRLGTLVKPSSQSDKATPGPVIGATLGLLAFMLAFTFNMTSSRFDERKHLLVEEMSDIGTTYLRAGLLAEPYATDSKALLRKYVGVRVQIVNDPKTLLKGIARSTQIQNELWAIVLKMSVDPHGNEYRRLYIQSLNDMMDMQSKRVADALYYRIPGAIWLGLFTITFLAMVAVGYQFGQSKQHHPLINLMLAIAFSSVIVLIADLDRESQGLIRVNQQPLFSLQKQLEGSVNKPVQGSDGFHDALNSLP